MLTKYTVTREKCQGIFCKKMSLCTFSLTYDGIFVLLHTPREATGCSLAEHCKTVQVRGSKNVFGKGLCVKPPKLSLDRQEPDGVEEFCGQVTMWGGVAI